MKLPLPKFRLKRFSLRALLAAVTAAAISCGWIAAKTGQQHREDETVAAIRESCDCDVGLELSIGHRSQWSPGVSRPGGNPWYWKPQWLMHVYVYDRTQLHVRGALRDGGLRLVSELPRLQELFVHHDAVLSADGLAALANLSRLETLYLGNGREIETDLDFLAGMRRLKTLHLHNLRPTAAGWQTLQALPKLEALDILLSRFDVQPIPRLSNMTQLKTLRLAYVDTTGDAAWLDRLPTGLISLAIDGLVSDAELLQLSRLTSLEYLDLRGTRATPDSAHRLQQILPNCEVRVPNRSREEEAEANGQEQEP